LGQKVHPIGFRLGINRTWESKWYADSDYSVKLHADLKLRNFLKKRLYHAGISKIELERAANKVKINIFAARPGIIIGKKRRRG
jgi:small subunit ribosomal protein S3